MPRGQRLALLALAAVVAIVAVVLIRPGSGGKQTQTQPTGSSSQAPRRSTGQAEPRPAPAEPRYTAIRIQNGKPVGGAKEITVKSGSTVRLAITSNTAEEVHVHGYDRLLEVTPGKPARVSFPAKLEGVFDIESHRTETKLASLKVMP